MNQALIVVVGQNASGKTHFSKRLADDLNLERVNGDDFRTFVARHTRFFADINRSSSNEKMERLSQLVITYRFTLTKTLLGAGCTVIFDGSGATPEWRKRIREETLDNLRHIPFVIISTEIPEADLLKRLEERDRTENAQWVKHYYSLKKDLYKPPAANEADHILTYNQHNYDEVLVTLKQILEMTSKG